MKFTIPKNLDLERLILSHETIELKKRTTANGKRVFKPVQVKSKSLLKHLPYCYYLINTIISRSHQQKDIVAGYVNLRSELLDKVIPHHTRILVTNLLEQLDVIQINKFFYIKEVSKSYRLHPNYSIIDSITINIELPLKGHCILEPLLSNNNEGDTCTGGNPYAVSFLKRIKKVESGIQKARDEKTKDLINNNIEYAFQQHQVHSNINLNYGAIAEDGVMNVLKPLIEKINNGNSELSINVNNKVNRVFSPITNLKKEHRKYLTSTYGSFLIAIDFKTSHLFHLLKKIIDCGAKESLLNEVQKVRALASDDIYQYVANQYMVDHGKLITRKEAKDLFITRFLYGMYPNRKMSAWVKGLFPEISKFVDQQGRKKLSIELQQSESYLLNNMIFKRIATECGRDVTVFGVFDSVLVDENNFDMVYCIMQEESAKYFGYEVPMSIKEQIGLSIIT